MLPKKLLWTRVLTTMLIYSCLLAIGLWGGSLLKDILKIDSIANSPHYLRKVLWFGVMLYVVLLAIPFVPGIEISLAVLAAFGKEAALSIYLASIAALALAYLVGRLVPLRSIASVFRYFGLTSAEGFIEQLEPLSRHERLAVLVEAAPQRIVPTLVKNRYLAIVVMLNLPGNALIGGGGGIALLAGMSGLFAFAPFVGIVAIAVAPIPLAAYLLAG